MNQAIVVVHHKSKYPWFRELESSLEGVKYPVIIVDTDTEELTNSFLFPAIPTTKGFELGALDAVYRQYDEVLLLQDTTYIKNHHLFTIVFEEHAGHSVAFNDPYQCYLMKFRRDRLNQMTIPEVRDKDMSVHYESVFTKEYAAGEPVQVIFTNFGDTPDKIYKHGQERMIIENSYLIKYKAHYE